MTRTPEILIVGAGPTGLALANALAYYGIAFSIVDRKAGPSRDSKGLTLSLGTQYGLQAFGLMDAVGKRGCRIRRANVYWEGRRFSAIDFGRLKLPTSSLITQPQPDSEHDLLEPLREKGIEVQWNTCLTDISQSAERVRATFADGAGRQASRDFDWAIGCEGKNSLVRDRMGAVLRGHDYAKYFVLGDFSVATNLPADQLHYYVYPDTFFILIPIGGCMWRVVVKYDGEVPDDAPLAEDVTTVVNGQLGARFRMDHPVWLSRAPFYMRTSDKLRQGRMFIAGDAAHLFSPIGGTGMNTGIQDAINIAWKLALKCMGHAHDDILDAYEAERLEVINQTAAATDTSTRIICGALPDSDVVDKMRPLMRNRRNLRSILPTVYSGLDIRYTKIYSRHNDTALPGARRAGEVCFGRQKLRDLLDKHIGKMTRAEIIIAVEIDGPIGMDQLLWLDTLSRLANTYPALAPIIVFMQPAHVDNDIGASLSGAMFSPGNTQLRADVGVRPGGLLVVAPDGYIVFSGRLADSMDIERILLRVFSLRPNTQRDDGTVEERTVHDMVLG